MKLDDPLVLALLFFCQAIGQPIHLHSTDNGGIDGLIRGLARKASQKFDWFFTKQLSRSLFTGSPPHGPGHDLMSLNIQRGRDHGLPGWSHHRSLHLCNPSFEAEAIRLLRENFLSGQPFK